ncbi:energy-coupling factor ABC transporter ATP-binding protein [Streptococcus downei]|uniref:Cobalt/nickel transport system ATP-binding protein n=1 Tax=Streptococcus downei MFe28 TaxID=764290 RepID=A0A380JED2_STRDO|nr:energy-coupling factor ABC transporter ATP-binding protein [Streptococcus downei]EFQ56957.1 cobalt ABC transporter, ATP-binding protein [Streptococcus downei F0415]SUN35376.1 cobalt/nickel transport system ATP-binding protein [Streptococcus downei MFe28]
MTDIISVDKLNFKYQEEDDNILKDVTFHVKQGEWLAILGHNGSGKSTLVRLLDGLLEAQSGQIRIAGQVLSETNVWDLRRKIGMVFQNPDNQFVGATVADDVAFGLENQGLPYEEMKVQVQEALDLVGMADFAEREPARLSGGQKQRVAIAGIVAMRPEILILDEATSMLDPEGRLDLMATIKTVRDKYAMTVISITHDLDEVAMSDRVLVMKAGQIESSSTPSDLLGRGDDLLNLGLDIPFSSQLIRALKDNGLALSKPYLDETTLGDELWALVSNK